MNIPVSLALFAGFLVSQVSARQPNSTLSNSHHTSAAQSIHFPSISLFKPNHTASSNGTKPTQATHLTTAAPKPTCFLHNQDPDQGINQAYCLCDQTATLSPLSVATDGHQSDSCAYSTIPATGAQATITTATSAWTSNCQACTVVGGIADSATCTSVDSCTPTGKPKIVAWVSNSTIAIGDAEDANGGKTLSKELFDKLNANCQGTSCSQDMATMDNVEYIVAGGDEPLIPEMYIQDASATSKSDIQKMLAVGISSWVGAMQDDSLGLCQNVTYRAEADMTGSGCGQGPIQPSKVRRIVRTSDNKVLSERDSSDLESRCNRKRDGDTLEERGCGGTSGGNMECNYSARMCNAPNEITVVQTDGTNAIVGFMNLGVDIKVSDSNSFSCEDAATIIGALTAVTALLAPEMLEGEALEDMDLMTACGVVSDVQGAINAITSAKSQKRATIPLPPAVSTSSSHIVPNYRLT